MRFILEDDLLNTDEKAAYWQEMFALTDKENPMSDDEYLRQGFWSEKTEQTPENLVATIGGLRSSLTLLLSLADTTRG